MATRTKKLTRKEFDAAVSRSKLGDRARLMAKRVLVGNETYASVAEENGVTYQAVNHHVNAIWKLHVDSQDLLPGQVRVTAILPEDKAAIVREWERDERIRQIKLIS